MTLKLGCTATMLRKYSWTWMLHSLDNEAHDDAPLQQVLIIKHASAIDRI